MEGEPSQMATGPAAWDDRFAKRSNGHTAWHSPSSILRRVAYAVEPFGFELVPRELPPPLLKGECDRLWQQPDLFEQVDDG